MADDIVPVVADVDRGAGIDAELVGHRLERPGFGLLETERRPEHDGVEHPAETAPVGVGVAVGQQADTEAFPQPTERAPHLRVQLDLVEPHVHEHLDQLIGPGSGPGRALAVTEEDADGVAVMEYSFGPVEPAPASEEEIDND